MRTPVGMAQIRNPKAETDGTTEELEQHKCCPLCGLLPLGGLEGNPKPEARMISGIFNEQRTINGGAFLYSDFGLLSGFGLRVSGPPALDSRTCAGLCGGLRTGLTLAGSSCRVQAVGMNKY